MKPLPITALGALAALLCTASVQPATATTLAVPYYAQRTFFDADNNNISQWCWCASSQMVLGFYGYALTQDTIAAYGSQGLNVPNYMYGGYPATATMPALNGIDLILKRFGGIKASAVNRALSPYELFYQINSSRPVIARLGWSSYNSGSFRNNSGGHFVVLYGFDGTLVDVNDPWPDNGQLVRTYSTMLAAPRGSYTANSQRCAWTHTLTMAASLDVAFVFDSSGGMADEISNVKTQAQSIVTNIMTLFGDARIAVVDYKDNPNGINGGAGDYITHTDASFTTNTDTILSAIDSLSASGGGDAPEAVYSALYRTLDGGIVGGWRTNSTPRLIILLGAAPGHDPVEPWTGGYSMADVLAKATAAGAQTTIDALVCGNSNSFNPDAVTDFASLAGGTGGALLEASSSSEVGGELQEAITQASLSERYPRDSVAAFQPKFSFNLLGEGMADVPSYYMLELMRSNTAKGTWTLYSKTRLKTNSYTPKSPLPRGTYRWRLGFMQPATPVLSPSGVLLKKVKGGLVSENQYVQFERQEVDPGSVTLLSPSSASFSATNAAVTYTWDVAVNASSYALCITNGAGTNYWKRLIVKPSAKSTATTLKARVGGHKLGTNYSWGVKALNYDHPKP